MSIIRCAVKLASIGSWIVLVLPKGISAKLPSRGMVAVQGTVNGFRVHATLEPDGKGSHWLRFSKALCKAAGADAGDTVALAIEPAKEWPEPKVPADVQHALATAPKARTLWMEITPIARWDWIRWIGATKSPATRRKHIVTAVSMLKGGKRRPCCFNRSMCTEPAVSHNGRLLEPKQE